MVWRLPSPPSETARCTSTGDRLARPLMLPPSSLVTSQGWKSTLYLLLPNQTKGVRSFRPRPSSEAPSQIISPISSVFLFTGRPGRSSNARVGRAPSERARSASRRTARPPIPPSEGALREHRMVGSQEGRPRPAVQRHHHSALSHIWPVLIRTAATRSNTKIFPSPALSVCALRVMVLITRCTR